MSKATDLTIEVTAKTTIDRESAERCLKMVEQARRDGLAICNDQDDDGYYIADDPSEYDRQFRRIYDRAMSMMVQLKHFRANRGISR